MAGRTGLTTVDERGREVQSMQRGQSKRQRPEEALRVLWEEGTVDTQLWGRFAAAGATHYDQPEDCANFADALYIEMMLRQSGQ